MTRGVYLLLAFLFVFSMVNLVNTLMTNLLARQQERWVFCSLVGMNRKATGFPYADRRMPVVRRGYGIFVSWYWRNPGLDF